MKKLICLLVALTMILVLAGCAGSAGDKSVMDDSTNSNETNGITASEPDNAGEPADNTQTASDTNAEIGNVDVDLTMLSSTMVYSEVYNMTNEPDDYIGKTVRMNGQFVVYTNQDESMFYPAVIVADAAACCAQGIEFVLAGENNYPNDYPELETDITVTGVFEPYTENGYVYYHLANAVVNS